MPIISWNDDFSVQNKDMDEQHKRLIDLINELHDLMSSGKGRTAIALTLSQMVSYANIHFTDEETLLKKINYPELEDQKKSHDAYTQKALDLQKRYQDGQISLTVETMSFLKEWWTKHILDMDKKYSSYLK